MKAYVDPLWEINEYREMAREFEKGPALVQVTGCIDSQKCHFLAGLADGYPVRLIVTYNDLKAREIFEDMHLYDPEVLFYPSKDVLFYSADMQGNTIVKQRLSVIKRLLSGKPATVVCSIDAGLDRLLPLSDIKKKVIHIEETDETDLDELSGKLVALGYEKELQVSVPGEFAIRGGIIDIFPLNEEAPVRIELFGDEIDSIKIFDVDSQRSIERIEEFDIFPASEYILTEEETSAGIERINKELKKTYDALEKQHKPEAATRLKSVTNEFIERLEYSRALAPVDSYILFFKDNTVSFFDYFDEKAIIILDEPANLIEKGEATKLEFRESMANRLERGDILPSQAAVIFDYKKLLGRLAGHRTLMLSTLDKRISELSPKIKFDVYTQAVASCNGDFSLLSKELTKWKKKGYRIIIQAGTTSRANHITKALYDEYDINAFFSDDPDRVLQPGEIMVRNGSVHKGFEYPYIKFVVISESDLFGTKKTKIRKKYVVEDGKKIKGLADLAYGDYVVHESHGIGIYKGIEKIPVDKVAKDYITIEYSDGGKLYIPATNLDVIQKYASAETGHKPKLNKLNSVEWKNTKERVHHAVKDMAEELVKLYATRQAISGYAFGPDTPWQKEFEDLFPFEETDDQIRAIAETKRDMESKRIMDRLICGDVGFGKTEIAIRAAFKAVMDGRQVVVLVPTTVLAQQHYNTFSQRMARFGARVDLLSRFCTEKQAHQTIEGLKTGEVDVVIGTHKVLSGKVTFKNLGLLIVDEEQRFGVSHKEKIKQLRNNVDVLTLTATPIPRTLHMSLSGIRDMSLLEEAPVDRMPIQTFVMEHNEEIIREAINRELARNGQVYYVFNRVNGIDEIAARVQSLVPEARVAFAHGQMGERALEKIMFDFINGEIDVLVSTTIIETGLDISNVNTMIIDNADTLGLSQLYQLRGRVGRSNRTSYAFLMYKRDKAIREVAEKRLAAIKEFTELGSGFKIAMRDLEIRGAGNLLGAEQSGHMSAVGYDMYCKMLNEAVRGLKNEISEREKYETTLDLSVDAFIPASYIKSEAEKLDIYKRIADIANEDDLSDMQDELTDRFGDIPPQLDNLLRVALLKAKCHNVYISEIKQHGDTCTIKMYPQARFKNEELDRFLNDRKGYLKLIPGKVPQFEYKFPRRRTNLTPKALADETFRDILSLTGEFETIKEEKCGETEE